MAFVEISEISAALFLFLGIGWLLAGGWLLGRWNIEHTADNLMLGRRIGAAYLGSSAILFLARSAPPSGAQFAICVGTCISLVLMAGLNAWDYKSRRAGPEILVIVLLQVALAFGFLSSAMNFSLR